MTQQTQAEQDKWWYIPDYARRRWDLECRSIPNAVRLSAQRDPAAEAVVAEDGRRTYAQLNDDMHRAVQAVLALGIEPGDRVGVWGPNSGRWILAALGIHGAGGVLVPINERETMADLIGALDLPVVVAARSGLGTINHTLMTIEVLRRRMQRVAGVVMIGEPNDENRLAIEKYGSAEVIGQMPRFDPLTPEALEQWAHAELDRQGVLFVAGLR